WNCLRCGVRAPLELGQTVGSGVAEPYQAHDWLCTPRVRDGAIARPILGDETEAVRVVLERGQKRPALLTLVLQYGKWRAVSPRLGIQGSSLPRLQLERCWRSGKAFIDVELDQRTPRRVRGECDPTQIGLAVGHEWMDQFRVNHRRYRIEIHTNRMAARELETIATVSSNGPIVATTVPCPLRRADLRRSVDKFRAPDQHTAFVPHF